MSGHVRLARPLGPAIAVLLVAGPLVGLAPAGAVVSAASRCAATDVVPAPGADRAGAKASDEVRSIRVDVVGGAESRATGLDSDAVRFARRGQPAGTVRVSPTWLEVPGQGTWTVDADSGDVVLAPAGDEAGADDTVTFTPEEGYGEDRGSETGAADEVPAPALVVPCEAVALPDRGETDQGVGVTLRPLTNDLPGAAAGGERATFDGSRLGFDADALPDGAELGRDDRRLVVPGEGAWTIGDAGRTVGFVPEPGFTGRTSGVRYAAKDSAGHRLSSLMRVQVGPVAPSAEPDTARTTQATPVEVDVLANDDAGADSAPLDPATLRLETDEDRVEALEVDGEGSWSVVDGGLEFAPADDFTGTTEPVTYSVADGNGTRATSTAQVAVAARAQAAPADLDAVNDRVTAPYGKTVRIPVLDNDVPQRLREGGKVWLLDETGLLTEEVKELETDQGTWSVVNRELEFEPDDGFSGIVPPVVYRVRTAGGLDQVQAKVFLTIGKAVVPKSTEVTTTSDKAVTADVLGVFVTADGVELRPGSVFLFPDRVRVDGKLLKVAKDAATSSKDVIRKDVGRWEVDDNGDVTFTPRGGFVGRAAIGFRVRGEASSFYTSTMAVEVTKAPVTTTTTTPTTTTTTPYSSTTTTTTGGTLPDTGGPTFLALLGGLVLVGAGGVLLRRSRRTT